MPDEAKLSDRGWRGQAQRSEEAPPPASVRWSAWLGLRGVLALTTEPQPDPQAQSSKKPDRKNRGSPQNAKLVHAGATEKLPAIAAARRVVEHRAPERKNSRPDGRIVEHGQTMLGKAQPNCPTKHAPNEKEQIEERAEAQQAATLTKHAKDGCHREREHELEDTGEDCGHEEVGGKLAHGETVFWWSDASKLSDRHRRGKTKRPRGTRTPMPVRWSAWLGATVRPRRRAALDDRSGTTNDRSAAPDDRAGPANPRWGTRGARAGGGTGRSATADDWSGAANDHAGTTEDRSAATEDRSEGRKERSEPAAPDESKLSDRSVAEVRWSAWLGSGGLPLYRARCT